MPNPINYIHSEKISQMSHLMKFFMSIFGVNKLIENQIKSMKASPKAAFVPKKILKNYEVNENQINGRKIWTLKPKQNATEKVVFYLHGGAYVFNISNLHWNLIYEFLTKTNANFIIADYPLAPESTFNDVYDFLDKTYEELLKQISSENLIFMGDSAGGGLALSFAQKLRNENKQVPSQIILLSPWLDLSMSNPEISNVEKYDKILTVKGLKMAAKSYSDNTDLSNYLLSPLFGDFSNLATISIFVGTHEVFIYDIRKLKQLLDEKTISVNYFEYPKMFHDWHIITQLKESKKSIEQISDLINN